MHKGKFFLYDSINLHDVEQTFHAKPEDNYCLVLLKCIAFHLSTDT